MESVESTDSYVGNLCTRLGSMSQGKEENFHGEHGEHGDKKAPNLPVSSGPVFPVSPVEILPV